MRARVVAAGLACVVLSACGSAQALPAPSAPAVVPSASPSPSVSASPSAASSPTPSPVASVAPTASSSPVKKPTTKASESSSWKAADMSAAIPLVSKEYRLPASYVPKQTGSWGLTPDPNAAMLKLIAAARADGVKMQVRSGYRSYATQKSVYESALKTYSSVEQAKLYNAPPGASEHQSGLSADMWDGANRGYAFRGTPTDTWLAANAYKYGFIIRYPKGKTPITGYMDEPWHLRYVGVDVAAEFGPNNTLTLEEYLGR